MYETVVGYFLSKPARLMDIGRVLAELGAGLIVAGLIGRLFLVATSGLASLGGQAGLTRGLADVFPSFPTWWVPETIIGAIPALMLLGLGMWCHVTGRHIRRLLAR